MICEYGIQGSDPATDHVADAGTLQFTMDDGAKKHTYGIFSPLNPSRFYGFDLNAQVRWSIGQSVGTRYYKFVGSLSDITTDPGIHSEHRSRCTAVDIWDDFAQTKMPELSAQLGATSSALVTTLLDALPYSVPQRSIDTGVESFPFAFDGGSGQGLMVREALQQICMSEFGYAYRKGDLLTGNVFVFENRSRRVNNPPVLTALTDADIVALDAPASRDDVYRTVRINIHPMKVDTANVVLYSLDATTTTTIGNGETITIIGPYRNPDNEDQLAGGMDMVDPVPTTDYLMNVSSDGLGTDLTSGFTVFAGY